MITKTYQRRWNDGIRDFLHRVFYREGLRGGAVLCIDYPPRKAYKLKKGVAGKERCRERER